jgi:hypothetical protein
MSEPKDNNDGTFTDRVGTIFSTSDGKTPGTWGVSVTIHQDGQAHSGIWTGNTAEKSNS